MPRFIIDRAGQPSQVFEVSAGRPVSLGRAKANNIVLDDPSVSRMHAVARQMPDGRWQIVDRGSANGMRVNGVAVKEAALQAGDVLKLGEFTLHFEDSEKRALIAQGTTRLPPRLAQALNELADEAVMARAITAGGMPDQLIERRVDLGRKLRTLERENQLLTLLYRVSRHLNELGTVEEVCERILDRVLEIEGAERGYAMLLEAPAGPQGVANGAYSFSPAIIRDKGHGHSTCKESATPLKISQSIIRQVLEAGQPLLISDVHEHPQLSASRSVVLSGMQSAMCAPLRSGDRVFGLLYVDSLARAGIFKPEDMEVFAVIAAQAGLAIDRVRSRQEIAEQQVKLAVLERFVAPEVAHKIASDPAGLRLGGESQRVSILFLDIRGFTALTEALRPEPVVEMLNGFFQCMTEIVFAHNGTIDKYLGDGLMCLFGAPLARETHPLDAAQAAVEMQASLAEFNRACAQPLIGSHVHMGIGINSGAVVLGYLGSHRRMDYTAIGDVVNVAAGLTAEAAADQILLGAETYAAICDRFATRRLEPIKLKGRTGLVATYELLWRDSPAANNASAQLAGSVSRH